MATTDVDAGFNSLDPLGPEYGKINAPLLDSKGVAPFEGDRIKMPEINFPITPSFGSSLDMPQHNVRTAIISSPPNKPGAKKPFDYNAFVKGTKDQLRGQLQTSQDKSSYGKIYSYDAGPDGNAFYKRYQAYGQDTFDKIGFSPLRDNEAVFNSRTTMWDDHKRMMQHSFWPLFGRGFIAGPQSLWKMAQGDFTSTDTEDARAYADAAAIGQTTKGGVMGFTNNMLMNFGYSAGIMSEAIIEEAVGTLLAPETLGGSFFLTTANAAKNTMRAIKGLDIAVDGYKAVNTTLKAVDNVNDARNFWKSATNVAKMDFSPIKNTATALSSLGKTVEKGDQVYNLTNLAKIYKTAGGFYKDVRGFNMALSEARLEAGMVENQIYDNGYNAYYNKFGEAPGNKEQYTLLKEAKKGSLDTLYWNTALIYGSNAITFPNIMGPKGGVAGFMKNTIKEFTEVGGGKFGNLGKVVYDQSKKAFAFRKNNLVNMVKDYGRQPLYKSVKGTVGYFKANFTEGIQESLQEVISGANEKYYSDAYDRAVIRSHEYAKGVSRYNVESQGTKSKGQYYKEELKNQKTGQGFETFASGFFMGMLATPLNAAIPHMFVGYNRVFNPKAYQEFKTEKLNITKNVVNNLNAIDMKDFLDSKIFNYATQDAVASIKNTGTKKEAHDADLDGFLSQMNHVNQMGAMGVFRDKLNELKQLTPEEFEDNIPNIPKGEGAKYQAKIDDVVKKTERIEQRYKYYQDKHPNPISNDNLPPKGTPEYDDAVALYHAWNRGVENAIYFNEAFEDGMKRKVDIQGRFLEQSPLKTMTHRDSEVIFQPKELKKEIGFLKNEIDTLKSLKDADSKQELISKEKKLAALEKLEKGSSSFGKFFNRYQNTDQIRKMLQEQKGGEEVTDEEVEAVLDNVLGEFSDDNKIKITSDYESAYKGYLKTIAELNDDYLFDQKVDESFALLMDHHKLDHESKGLMKYINLLHDPGGFLEMVDRNRQWMKDLYKKRGAIYDKMVNEELDLVTDNALLNTLANKGVYISMEAFENWKNNGIPPTEFFDNTKKIIIPEGSSDYEMYYMLFEQASELKDEKSTPVRKTFDKELQEELDKLELQKENELANVPVKEVREDIKTIKNENGQNLSFSNINNELQPNQFADCEFIKESDNVSRNLIIRKDSDGSLIDVNIDEKIPDTIDQTVERFVSADVYEMVKKPDPELAQPIIDRYEDLKNEVMQEYALKEENAIKTESESKEEFVPITTDIDIESMPASLYNNLYKLFQEKQLKKLSDEEFTNMSEDEERNLFIKFIQGSVEAKQMIDEYNKEAQVNQATKETGEKENFQFIYQGKTFDTENIKTLVELRTFQRRFKALLKTLNDKKNPTADDLVLKSNYMVLIKDFDKLINTRAKQGRTPEMQTAIDLIEKLRSMQDGIEQSTEGYKINDILHERVSNVISKLKSTPYGYKDQSGINIAFGLTIEPNGFNQASINAFIAELRKRGLSGFSNFTYNELTKDLNNLLATIDTLEDTSNKNLLKIISGFVSEKTYEESRISGNYLDAQVKNLFDGKEPVFNEDNITREAFDNLFGPKGVLSELKTKVDNGELYIVSQGIRVYDTELKIAGEIDLLVADSKGNITIVDLKSGEKNKWDGFKDPNNKYSKEEDYQLQQTAYANLLNRMLGVNAAIAILPIQMVREAETGRIMSAGKPTAKNLLTSDSLISLNKAPVAERINSIIPLRDTKEEVIITPSQVVPEDNESSEDEETIVPDDTTGKEGFINDADRVTVKDIQDQLDKANTIDDVKQVIADLNISVSQGFVTADDVAPITEAIKTKVSQLSTPQEVILKAENLEKGTELIAKNNINGKDSRIFASTSDAVMQNDIIVVESIDTKYKVVTASLLGKAITLRIPFNELNDNFSLKEVIMGTTEQPVETLTPEDKSLINETTDLTSSFIENTNRIDEIEKSASTKSIKELDDDLLDDIDCK